ncbi:MAG: sporulation protein YunB [Halanaerobiaceae bacterium]
MREVVKGEIKKLEYQDLITYKVNNEGDIVLLQPNTARINSFSSSISIKIQERLESISDIDVPIPLLKLLGLDIIAAMGPDLYAKIIPVGFVHPPTVRDSFESAGINQTRHKIYLKVDVRLKLIIPFSQRITQLSADLPVTEVTILGKVPEVYVGLNSESMEGIINPEK